MPALATFFTRLLARTTISTVSTRQPALARGWATVPVAQQFKRSNWPGVMLVHAPSLKVTTPFTRTQR